MTEPERRKWAVRPVPPLPQDVSRENAFEEDRDYVRRLLITISLGGLAYFLWRISRVLLLLFAAVLLAVLLRSFANLIARLMPILESRALAVATLATAALVTAFLMLFGSQIGSEISRVVEALPRAIDTAGNRLGIDNASAELENALASSGASLVSRVAGFGYTALGALTDCAIVVVAAIYLAADPRLYRWGAAKLLPPSQHERVLDAMDASGTALRLWFTGQLIAMILVGVVSGLAYWWIGLPSPLALAVIAGVTNFVPFLGPILGAVPALIFALSLDLQAVLWTIGVVAAIQQLEGNVITPFIQRRAVLIPPVIVLFAILVFGLLFGVLGVFLAVPLAVTISVLVKKLWVRQTLGEETVVPGEEVDNSSRDAAR